MTYTIENKVALVTGANRGIGKALTQALVLQGARRIYATARNLEDLASLVAEVPDVIVPIRLDVNNAKDIAALANGIDELDLLINNAGIATGSTFTGEDSLKIAQLEMATNYFGPVNLTHALMPVLRKSSEAAVINISSVAALGNFPVLGPYSASKAAVHSFTQGLRAELRKSQIAVIGVYPGPTDTRLAEGSKMPKAKPADVANAILEGLKTGVEDVMPDSFSQAIFNLYSQNPKAVEEKFSAMID